MHVCVTGIGGMGGHGERDGAYVIIGVRVCAGGEARGKRRCEIQDRIRVWTGRARTTDSTSVQTGKGVMHRV